MGLNLHGIVRGAINAVHPDEEVQLLRSLDSVPDANGFPQPKYLNFSAFFHSKAALFQCSNLTSEEPKFLV